GFAFAWNNGDHSSGAATMRKIKRWYPPERFARNQSYPAFGNSSIDGELGGGEIEQREGNRTRKVLHDENGALEGGVNLGFVWNKVVDEDDNWSLALSNELATEEMTVDVTPRRCQKFKPRPGENLSWGDSAGGSGTVAASQMGLVTIEIVTIKPGRETVLTITK
ncbi:MAG: hypothetical protein N2C14_21705, partial [Planctomycetales bacterium]